MAPVPVTLPLNGNDTIIKPVAVVQPKEEENRTRSKKSRSAFPRPPKFEDKLEEREYIKFRLAQAFRIFGSLGYDEGVAGHVTARVCSFFL